MNTIIADIVAEYETLRARLAELEKQEPVGKTIDATTNTGYVLCTFNGRGTPVGTKLYAAPVVSPDIAMLELCITRWKGLYERERDLYDKLNNENQSLKTELEAARNLSKVARNFEITGPDDDGIVWLLLHGKGTTGKAMFNLGTVDRLAVQVALHLEADRSAAIEQAKGAV